MPLSSEYASRGRHMIEQASSKPLALLIPGLDGTGRFYERHLPLLSERFRPCAWEYRRRAVFDFADLVSELSEATESEPPGSVVVVGESFGGPVAIQYVLACPERVKKLVLINSFAFYSPRLRIGVACRLVPLLRLRGFRAVKCYVVDRTLELEGIRDSELRLYHETVKSVYLPAYRRRLELVRQTALRSRLAEIRTPALILASGRDKIVPSVAEAHYMAMHIPAAEVHLFPRAGHALLLTPGFSLADYI